MTTPYWQSTCGRYTLYHGDCLAILPTLEAGSVDAVVTDPPYGVGLDYASFDDTQENVSALAAAVLPEMRRVGRVVALTPGNSRQHMWGVPSWTMCWFYGGGANYSPWGFNCWQPVMVWGKDPYLAAGMGCRADALNLNEPAKRNGHPCPKPIGFVRWLVERVTVAEDQTILDPFLGSGTTGVACVKTNRRFIGVEIEERYCEIAAKRIEKEASHLFAEAV